ncbi:MAG: M48 family metalloprotease [Planctomycetes bacterium]|nr:M48 family metalloprotease [Planctomycetota bacterium]
MNWLLANTGMAAAFAMVVLVVCRFGRPRPAVAHLLWAAVLLRLVAPPLLQWQPDWWPQPVEIVEVTPAMLVASPALAAPTGVGSPAPEVVPVASFDWLTPAVVLWIAGSAVFAASLLLALLRAAWRLRRAPTAPGWLQAEVTALAVRLEVAAPRLIECPAAKSPFVWSLWEPCLLLDSGTLGAADRAARTAVLAHELAHLRRRDHWVAWFELVLAVALWWHPLFWFARAKMREQAELACDAWALNVVPEARLGYADALIRSLQEDQPAAVPLALAARPSERRAFERRLSMILEGTVPSRLSRWTLLPLAALTLGAFCSPVLAQDDRKPRIEIRINGKDISEMSPRERQQLLRELGDEGVKLGGLLERLGDEAEQEPAQPKIKVEKKVARKKATKVAVVDEDGMVPALGDLGGDVRAAIQQGLAEAKAEIAADEDLAELGIRDDVLGLLDSIGSGKGLNLGESIDGLVGKALRGAARMAKKEIAADEDLRRLGLGDGIGKLIDSLVENEDFTTGLGGLVQQAMKAGVDEALTEIGNDADLRELGLTDDVQGLVRSLLDGDGDFDASLEKVIGKAMKAAMQQAEGEVKKAMGEGDGDDAPKPAKKGKAKGKKARVEIR